MPANTKHIEATDRCGHSIPLPVLSSADAPGPIRPSKMGKWRAAALIGVYLLMIGHFVQWKVSGRTLTPVEPSESMETLRTGAINAGAVFFAGALLATLIFGRFVCGWACHIVALQDLCGWALKKAGLRPRPFRSRLLVFIPLISAVYMFLWPTAVRIWFGVPRPATTWRLETNSFWATFPGPVVGGLTIVICGFAIVWFLGNKGFCTYACPYGGFFGVLDNVSPMRIRVTDACNQCGHCSAVCTSNVRVAEEVKLYGMVVDTGCMKCMDCVSVCPNDALYVGWGRPGLFAPMHSRTAAADSPRRSNSAHGSGIRSAPDMSLRKPLRYDGTWAEEFAMAAIFVATMLSLRGLYDQVPFLFSLGLSAITSIAALKAWQLITRENLTLHTIALKRAGRITRGGRGYTACVLVWVAFVAHSGFVQFHRWRGDCAFDGTTLFGKKVGATPALTGWPITGSIEAAVLPTERVAIERARAHLSKADRWGLMRLSPLSVSLAWLDVLEGKTDDAERRLRAVLAESPQSAAAHVALGEVLLKFGKVRDAEDEFRRAQELDANSSGAWFGLGLALLKSGDAAGAADSMARAFALPHHGEEGHAGLDGLAEFFYAEALRRAGRVDESLEVELRPHGDARVTIMLIGRALPLDEASAMLHRAMGVEMARLGDATGATREVTRAVDLDRGNFNSWMHLGRLAMAGDEATVAMTAFGEAERIAPQSWQAQAHLAAALTIAKRFDEAVERGRRAVAMNPDSADARATLGAALISKGDVAGALSEYREAVRLEPRNEENQLRFAFLLAGQGQMDEAVRVLRGVATGPDAEARAAAERMLAELRAR